MILRIGVIGAEGNMGKRYMQILKYIPWVTVVPIEVNDSMNQISHVDGAIIASPTDRHLEHVSQLAKSNSDMPILCEKPICFSADEAEEAFDMAKGLRMVNQYEFAVELTDLERDNHNHTFYDYFRTGKDGLLWDCINVIGLAEGTVQVDNKSPIWRCCINGQPIRLHDIDAGYVDDVTDWLRCGGGNAEYAIKAHRRVEWLIGA